MVFEGAVEAVRNFTVTEREMTKYIIGTISDMDVPPTRKPRETVRCMPICLDAQRKIFRKSGSRCSEQTRKLSADWLIC